MLPYICDYLRAIPVSPWLIVGKGPSFDSKVVGEYKAKGYKICSLNEAFHQCEVSCDLIVCNDIISMEPFFIDSLRGARLAIPSGIHNNNWKKVNDWDQLYQLSYIVKRLRPVTYSFNIDNLGCQGHNTLDIVEVHHSSSESAVQILCLSGVKQIHFHGIDGGTGYCKAFNQRAKVNMDNQFPFLKFLLDERFSGVMYSGLPERVGAGQNLYGKSVV
jgi:hypothetical protein